MKYRSTSRGEWPRGVYWMPGEVREIADSCPGADTAPPAWLEPVRPPKKKRKPAPKPEPVSG